MPTRKRFSEQSRDNTRTKRDVYGDEHMERTQGTADRIRFQQEYSDFLEKNKSNEVFYDPYQQRMVTRGVPLRNVYPEFELLAIGRGIANNLIKPRFDLSKETMIRKQAKRFGKAARPEVKRQIGESAVGTSLIGLIDTGK